MDSEVPTGGSATGTVGRLGLSTYAYFWRWSEANPEPLSLEQMLRDTRDLGGEVFQICDYPPLEGFGDTELDRIRDLAADLGLVLETGTRGAAPDHLRRHLAIAERLGSRLVRSMMRTGPEEPPLDEAPAVLAAVAADYGDRGVELALETYEQVPTPVLVRLVREVDHPALGIVLDPGNCVAALEMPADVVAATVPYVKNLHVKDFAFSRRDGWVGFTLAGARLGEGLLDYDDMVAQVRPRERGINQVVEHWLPWTDDIATTCRLERQWAEHNLDYLRSRNA
ncbi:sugar phosphate isomerase/epimerase family protein [Georgenia alba]|uniref:Sugar phosphate isomerase/epimerase family protein n=1 Tax=Georgenia alba TaxID=2233858 RepID=A0ABW2QBE4_9MICO